MSKLIIIWKKMMSSLFLSKILNRFLNFLTWWKTRTW